MSVYKISAKVKNNPVNETFIIEQIPFSFNYFMVVIPLTSLKKRLKFWQFIKIRVFKQM